MIFKLLIIIQLMNRSQAVETDQSIKQYMEKNKIRPMFADLVRQLILKKPQNPIEYLITYLDKRPRRLIVCLQGYDDDNRKRLAKIVSNKLNFKLIELSDIYNNKDYHVQNDTKINEKVFAQLNSTQSVYKGIIISGYPNNIQQVTYIQKSIFLPDRYFTLPFNSKQLHDKLKQKNSQEIATNIIKRHTLQQKQLRESLGEMLDFLPQNLDQASQILTEILNIKISKKNLPYDSPRVIFVHPPHLVPITINKVINKFAFHHINVQKSLSKLSKKQNFKDYVEKYIRKNGGVSKQIQLALIQTQCKSAAAKNKGYVLSGWPTKMYHLNYLKQKFLSPHMIFVFDLDAQACQQQFNKLQQGNPELFQTSQKPTIQKYREQLKQFEKVTEYLKQNYKIQILPWNQNQKQVLKTFESLIDNPKIYS